MDDKIGHRIYSCFQCRTPLSRHDDIVSKSFQSTKGRAFLFSHVMNTKTGPQEDRQLITGLHLVADVNCADCGVSLGWKYEKAYEESQKYKEGKVVLEKIKIVEEKGYQVFS
ncbi:Yippee/Mis18/Cereblon [Dillenia turbinata]|uniref:Protein yippee-like n=1 Tax=Dillenia turbinata TaxID=194707 RepID=A0AAN8UMB1_9MAGN